MTLTDRRSKARDAGIIGRFVRSEGEKLPTSTQATPKIIAAGLWRCATSSLQVAFQEHLDLTPSLHGSYIMPYNSRLKLCCAASLETDKLKRQKLLHQLFDGYLATSDYPGHAFVDDLMDMYPDAIVLLNTRSSAKAWQQSALASLSFYSTIWYLLLCGMIPQSYWHYRLYVTFKVNARRRLGVGDIWSEEMYHVHNAWVRDQARKRGREVVEWTPDMGWAPICKVLDVDEPTATFPRTNENKALQELKRYLIVRGLLAWALGLAVVLVMVVMHRRLQ